MADIATLGLELDGRRLRSEADQSTRSLDRMRGAGINLRSAMAKLGITLSAGLAMRKLINETKASQAAIAQLEAALASTSGVSGQTLASLEAMGDALQRTTTYGDEATHSAQALLLTFTQIGGSVFEDATRTVLDMATAMGTDLRSAAIQVGKALNDPVLGVTALSRVGVQFSDAQRDVIKSLVETGRQAEAQALILKELQTEFGGSAEAARNTLGGALAYLSNQWSDAWELSEQGSQGIIDAINALGDALPKVRQKIDEFVVGVEVWGAQAAATGAQIELLLAKMKFWDKEGIKKAEDALERMLVAMNDVITPLEYGSSATEDLTAANRTLVGTLDDQADAVAKAKEEWEAFLDTLKAVQTQQERFGAGKDVRRALQPIGGSVGGIGGGTVSANLSLAEGSAAYREYMAWVDRVRAAVEDSGPAWDSALRGVAALSDGLGLFQEATRTAIRAVSDIVSGLKDLKSGDALSQVGGGLSIAGATAGLVGGLVGLVDSIVDASRRLKEAARTYATNLEDMIAEIEAAAHGPGAKAMEDFRQAINAVAGDFLKTVSGPRHWMDDIRDLLRWQPGTSFEDYLKQLEELRDKYNWTAEGLDLINKLIEYANLKMDELGDSIESAGDAAESAALKFQSFVAEAYGVLGFGGQAGRINAEIGYERRLNDPNLSPADRAIIEAIRDADMAYRDRQDKLNADIESVNAGLDAQLKSLDAQERGVRSTIANLDEQIDIQRDALRVAEDQLREQERTVEETRRVVETLSAFSDSLALSGQSTLSPMGRLAEARRQYEQLLAAARGGDATAAGQLPGAASAFLEASRAVNASSTRYAADYRLVQETIAQVQGQFGGKLTAGEQTLTELRAQTDTLRAQIADLQAMRGAAEAQIDAIRSAADSARATADATIAQLQADAAKADEAALEQILQLIRVADATETMANVLETVRTDPGSGGVVVDVDFEGVIHALDRGNQTTVSVLSAGFTAMRNRLDALENAVTGVNSSVRRLEEVR